MTTLAVLFPAPPTLVSVPTITANALRAACFLFQVQVCSSLSKLDFLCFVSTAAVVLACGASLSGDGEIKMIYQTFCVSVRTWFPRGVWWLGRRW